MTDDAHECACGGGCRPRQVPNDLATTTAKLTVGGADLYCVTGWWRGRLAHVDLTLSGRGGPDDLPTTAHAVTLEQTKLEAARALLEVACVEARALLAAGVWSVDDIVAAWRGVRCDPQGICILPGGRVEIVSSPLDAVARVIAEQANRLTSAAE